MTSAISQVSLSELPMDNWMANLPSALWDTPLCYMAIPGSHNAITYCLDKNDRSPVDPTQPDMLQRLDKYMKPIIRPFVYKWAIAQLRMKDAPEALVAVIDGDRQICEASSHRPSPSLLCSALKQIRK